MLLIVSSKLYVEILYQRFFGRFAFPECLLCAMKHKNRHTLLSTYSFLLLRRALQDSCCVNGVWSHTYLLDCFLQQCWRPANFPDPLASWLCQWEVLAGVWKTRRREKPSQSRASGGTSGHSDDSSCMSVAPQQVQLLAPAQAIGITVSGKCFFFYSPSPRGQSCFFQLPFYGYPYCSIASLAF